MQTCAQNSNHHTTCKPWSICTSTSHSHHHISPACGSPLCNSSPQCRCPPTHASHPYTHSSSVHSMHIMPCAHTNAPAIHMCGYGDFTSHANYNMGHYMHSTSLFIPDHTCTCMSTSHCCFSAPLDPIMSPRHVGTHWASDSHPDNPNTHATTTPTSTASLLSPAPFHNCQCSMMHSACS